MHLPGRLSSSTLGDLLGTLHRRGVSGTIELSEIGGPRGFAGRTHRIHLRAGLVVAVESDLGIGARVRERVDALFRLEDARVVFRTARPLPPGVEAAALSPAEFLHGRMRARDKGRSRARACADEPPAQRADVSDPSERARRLLGVPREAAVGDVRRAFRKLAGALHPDCAPSAADEERARRVARFVELSAAYHTLVA